MRYLEKFVKTMEVKLRSKMPHCPKIPHRYGTTYLHRHVNIVCECPLELETRQDERALFGLTLSRKLQRVHLFPLLHFPEFFPG